MLDPRWALEAHRSIRVDESVRSFSILSVEVGCAQGRRGLVVGRRRVCFRAGIRSVDRCLCISSIVSYSSVPSASFTGSDGRLYSCSVGVQLSLGSGRDGSS